MHSESVQCTDYSVYGSLRREKLKHVRMLCAKVLDQELQDLEHYNNLGPLACIYTTSVSSSGKMCI